MPMCVIYTTITSILHNYGAIIIIPAWWLTLNQKCCHLELGICGGLKSMGVYHGFEGVGLRYHWELNFVLLNY